jgi:hypothetical protein
MPIRGSRPSLRLKVLYILFLFFGLFSGCVCVCASRQNKGNDGRSYGHQQPERFGKTNSSAIQRSHLPEL